MLELLTLEVFFALLLDFCELPEEHLVTLFFVSDLRFLLFLSILEVINQLLLHGEFFYFAHLIVDLSISLSHELFLASIVRLLDRSFLVNGLVLKLLHAHLVLTNLLILVINLLL